MTILKRFLAPMPKPFKKLRNLGFIIAGVGIILLASQLEWLDFLTKIAGCLIMAGGLISTLSHMAAKNSSVLKSKKR